MMPIIPMLMAASGGGGGGGATLLFTNPSSVVSDPLNASAELVYDNAGNCSSTGQGAGAWLLTGVVADYEIRLDITSGSTPSGSATASWLPLSTTRTWTIAQGTLGSNSSGGTIQIRLAAGGAIVDTASYTAYAEVF